MRITLLLSIGFCLTGLIYTPAFSQMSPDAYAPCQEMPNLITTYNADYQALIRFYTPTANASGFGRGGGGGEGGSFSPEKRARLESLCKEYQKKLEQIDFNSLSQECKVDYILFKRDLDESLKVSAKEAAGYAKIKKWFPFSDSVYILEKMRRRGHQPDAEATAKSWAAITNQLKQLKTKLKSDSTLSLDEIYQAGLVITDLKRSLASIYNFYNGYDPLFTWWMPKPYKELDEALTSYEDLFKEKNKAFTPADNSGIVGKPAGRDELLRQLKYEMIPYSPEELIDIANKEFAWCDAEMLKASKEMGFGDDWKAALEKVKNTYVPAGKQPEMILDLFDQSVDFLKKHDLITVPPLAEETFGMMMMTPSTSAIAFLKSSLWLVFSAKTASRSLRDNVRRTQGVVVRTVTSDGLSETKSVSPKNSPSVSSAIRRLLPWTPFERTSTCPCAMIKNLLRSSPSTINLLPSDTSSVLNRPAI